MRLAPFLLEQWSERHRDSVRYNLAASTGARWTLPELRSLMTEAEREAFDDAVLGYCPGRGRDALRAAIASMYGADPDEILTFTGAAEALLAFFYLAAEPGANVVIPTPVFPPIANLPESLGLETRRYELRCEDGFATHVDEIERLVDARTKLIMVNTPHNPSGAVLGEEAIRALDELAAERGIPLVVDEVYHPIYHGETHRSAGEYSRASVIGDFSKAFSMPGLRVGWLLERDSERRDALANLRGHFTVSSSMLSELLAEAAVNHRDAVWQRTREVSGANLAVLARWCAAHDDEIEWLPPQGSMTAFPRLRGVDDARPFCEAAAARGVLVVPGDCFGAPAHFRIGFGGTTEGYRDALDLLSQAL